MKISQRKKMIGNFTKPFKGRRLSCKDVSGMKVSNVDYIHLNKDSHRISAEYLYNCIKEVQHFFF